MGLPLRAALASSGRFDRVELRRGRRWNEWSLLVTMGGVESELAFVDWRLRPAAEATAPSEEHRTSGLHLRLVPRQPG